MEDAERGGQRCVERGRGRDEEPVAGAQRRRQCAVGAAGDCARRWAGAGAVERPLSRGCDGERGKRGLKMEETKKEREREREIEVERARKRKR